MHESRAAREARLARGLSPPYGPLAQSVEQLAFNQLVASSNLARPTSFQVLTRRPPRATVVEFNSPLPTSSMSQRSCQIGGAAHTPSFSDIPVFPSAE